ncbi:MAG: hypothetical protein F6K19_39435 [Cyanothece sp. SIO1E1]|nr:hypothetical protein [Cyanothece sp. SIO1E1]
MKRGSNKRFQQYRQRGGVRRSPLPDFYIGAHAQVMERKLQDGWEGDRPVYLISVNDRFTHLLLTSDRPPHLDWRSPEL